MRPTGPGVDTNEVSTYLTAVRDLTPSATSLIGAMVIRPDRGAETVLDWVGSFLDRAPAPHRLALLDGLLQACRLLEHGHTEMTGHTPAAPVAFDGDGIPADVLTGGRHAIATLASPTETLPAGQWAGYGNQAVSNLAYAGAVIAFTGYGATLVHAMAVATGAPVRDLWADLVSVLKDPID